MNQHPCAEPRGIFYVVLNLNFKFKKRSKSQAFKVTLCTK
jgi:hypothetical protein